MRPSAEIPNLSLPRESLLLGSGVRAIYVLAEPAHAVCADGMSLFLRLLSLPGPALHLHRVSRWRAIRVHFYEVWLSLLLEIVFCGRSLSLDAMHAFNSPRPSPLGVITTLNQGRQVANKTSLKKSKIQANDCYICCD